MYGNNSIVSVTDIGEGRKALLCITSETACCKTATPPPNMREWYFPNGSSVEINGAGHSFYRDRDPSIVRLNRRHNATSPIGIFRCIIPSSVTPIATKNIYIGIYDVGQGRVFARCHDHNGLLSLFFLSEQDPEFLKLHHLSLAEVANHLTVHLVEVLSQRSLGKGIIRN